jgi:hypothetical protein
VVDEHLEAVFGGEETNGDEPPDTGTSDGGVHDDAPALLHPAAADDPLLQTQSSRRWDVLGTCRLDPARSRPRGYRRIVDGSVSRTDPDATAMTMHRGGSAVGYQVHYLIDGGKARIILHAVAMSGDVMEHQPFLHQLRRVLFRWHLHPTRLIADAKYGTFATIPALVALGITAAIPLRDFDHKTGYFGTSHFRYDAVEDTYTCPAGQVLRRSRIEWAAQKTEYQADPAVCAECVLKAQCTPSMTGRQIHRSFHAAAMEQVAAYATTEAYAQAMRKRRVWIEPLFAEAKQWHGLRRFRLRRLWRVNCETLLVASCQNLKRYLAVRGWGRRHGPAGSLWATCSAPATILRSV